MASQLWALSVPQPWAWCLTETAMPLISLPAPPPSTCRPGSYLAIYSEDLYEGAFEILRMQLGLDIRDVDRALMFRPGIVAACRLERVAMVMDELAPDLGMNLPESAVAWVFDKYAWIISQPRPLPLVPVRDPQPPLWKVEGELLDDVRRAWKSPSARPPHWEKTL